MFKNSLICFAAVLCFYACSRFEKKQTQKTVVKIDSSKSIEPKTDTLNVVQNPDSEVYFNSINTVVKEQFKDSLSAKFSDLSAEDKFVITVPKGNINETKSIFQIFNSAGELYEKSFRTAYMANGYELRFIKNDAEMEKYILAKAKEMVNGESFLDISDKNEIQKDDVLGQSKENFINHDAFIDCQNDKRPLYSIFLGEEDMTYIGYSKKLKKAVDIIDCC